MVFALFSNALKKVSKKCYFGPKLTTITGYFLTFSPNWIIIVAFKKNCFYQFPFLDIWIIFVSINFLFAIKIPRNILFHCAEFVDNRNFGLFTFRDILDLSLKLPRSCHFFATKVNAQPTVGKDTEQMIFFLAKQQNSAGCIWCLENCVNPKNVKAHIIFLDDFGLFWNVVWTFLDFFILS